LSNRKSANEEDCDVDAKPVSDRECAMDTCKPSDYEIGVIITNTVVGISHWRIGPWSAVSNISVSIGT